MSMHNKSRWIKTVLRRFATTLNHVIFASTDKKSIKCHENSVCPSNVWENANLKCKKISTFNASHTRPTSETGMNT